MIARLRQIGPGALVTAAFIGPGTVTACTLAGANYGYALLWALLFATLATIILQEMSARLGLITRQGLGANLADIFEGSMARWPLIALVSVALYAGNAAYEAGNLSGAALGLAAMAGDGDEEGTFLLAVLAIALLAAGLLATGRYAVIERALLGLVAIMTLAFAATFAIVRPDLAALLRGLVTPAIPDGSLLTVIALIGTTIVPYNLFLHASAVARKGGSASALAAARLDTGLSIGVGGLIAILIASTAAASLFAANIAVESAGDMARQFDPLFGGYSRLLLGVGLLAAGLSSAITAPLATAFAMTEILRLGGGQASLSFRLIALSVLAIGAGLALTGTKPVQVILAAQFANGLLLPILPGFLLYAMNQRARLGVYVNGLLANSAGVIVVLIAAGLGARLVLRALQ
ncbi:MAG: Nramp family divalent metal transporter [Erythrobacter sp.]|uniref:Nramp family divalent metal transporter n=1 Tax=Erythrobacter sp. TaxID=1042 RepID=UPI00261EEACB|nr:Nramp family divalent metal transporter [Erythrobacter sp.]MDJ0979669.1 Nramp family divalent metal transporter [Erythrobacter sp.]